MNNVVFLQVGVGSEPGIQTVRAYGPGLYGGKAGLPADFVVESTGSGVGRLGILFIDEHSNDLFVVLCDSSVST